ncbi:MAG: MarR family transcriptional regulator [Proteobacteria bacterium]|nr:MarR family transcriptional regulator [Pseudomonadota bacterium]
MKNHVKTNTYLSERDEDICVDIFRNVMRVRHSMYQQAGSVAAQVDLHAAELNVIDILGKFGPISMGQLAHATFISPANTTSTVKKLEKADLVQRKRSDMSAREVTVNLTSKGRAIFRKCYPKILAEAHEYMATRLTHPEMVKLAGILKKLAV